MSEHDKAGLEALRAHIAALVARAWREERDALRERVTALEADKRRLSSNFDSLDADEVLDAVRTAEGAVARLAAIRPKIGLARDLLGDTSDNATQAWRLLVEVDDILGDDAPAPVSEWRNTCEHGGDHPAPEGEVVEAPQTDDLAAVEQWRENTEARARPTTAEEARAELEADGVDVPAFLERCRDTIRNARAVTPVEPTTAESFARIRDYLNASGAPYTEWDSSEPLAALTLLERRMVAQERWAKRAAESLEACGMKAMASDLRDTLTDAPLVFTIEEAETICGEVGQSWADAHAKNAVAEVLERLTALRRKP